MKQRAFHVSLLKVTSTIDEYLATAMIDNVFMNDI
jgi:hypothetical protein